MSASQVGNAGTKAFVPPVRHGSLAARVEMMIQTSLRDGTFAPGDQLPAESELAASFGVSRSTVRAAIASLVHGGLVIRRHGVGNFSAVGSLLSNDLSEAVDFNIMIERTGATAGVLFDQVSIVVPSAAVATALALGPADRVLRSAKRFTANGEVVIYVLNSIPVSLLGADLAAHAVSTPQITEPLFDFLEQSVGATTALELATFRAELGSDIDYPEVEVDIDPASPVLRFDEVGFGVDSSALWQSYTWFPPGEMSFELIRHRPGSELPATSSRARAPLGRESQPSKRSPS